MVDLRGKRIFIVEDNLENRIITRLALIRTGIMMEFDIWGRDTLKHLYHFAPVDLILLDLMLPGGASGYHIIDDIRRQPEFAQVPVAAISASDPVAAIARCRAQGFAGYIAKPIDDDLFPEQIARLINGEEVWYAG